MASKLAARLKRRLVELGFYIPGEISIARTRAGHWKRSEWAWSWSAKYADGQFKGHEICGSQWSPSEVAKVPKEWLHVYDAHNSTHIIILYPKNKAS